MKVAVVGGGIFGCTAALYAARAGHQVSLYEASGHLLAGASSHNQFRLHRGYHYPRSLETGEECRRGLVGFEREYGASIVTGERHLYAIASEGSKTTPDGYIHALASSGLDFRRIGGSGLENVSLAVSVEEDRYDPLYLREIVRWKLQAAGVQMHLFDMPSRWILNAYDMVVSATYATSARVSDLMGAKPGRYRFEVCEKPVIRMPDATQPGVVVMDGPFGCIDPYGPIGSGLYLMGHVEHAIHHTNVGTRPDLPPYLREVVHKGVVVRPAASKFPLMRKALAEFIPAVAKAEHIGSMFVVRTVLDGVDATDKRPTEVTRDGDRFIRIFAGKVPTCVSAAEQAVQMLDNEGVQQAA